MVSLRSTFIYRHRRLQIAPPSGRKAPFALVDVFAQTAWNSAPRGNGGGAAEWFARSRQPFDHLIDRARPADWGQCEDRAKDLGALPADVHALRPSER